MGWDVVVQIVGLIFAGVITGIGGFAFGLFTVGLLTSFHPSQVVISALLVVYFVTTSVLVFEHRQIINKRFLLNNPIFSVVSLVLGIIGLPLGSLVLSQVGGTQTGLFLGILTLFFSIYQLVRAKTHSDLPSRGFDVRLSPQERVACYVSSLMAGILEGFLGVGGVPLAIFMLARGYNKFVFVATFSLFFLLLSPFRLGIYILMGLYDVHTLKFASFITVFVIIGLSIGMVIRRRFVNDTLFKKIVLILLISIGINLIAKNV